MTVQEPGRQHIGDDKRCPHGKPLWCSTIHEHTDGRVGQPLCAECYDYLGHVLFTWHLPELWRRFTIALRGNLTKHLKSQGIGPSSVKASFVKVVEMQAPKPYPTFTPSWLDPPEGHASTATECSSNHNDHGRPPHVVVGSAVRQAAPPGSRLSAELATLIQQAARTGTSTCSSLNTNRQSDNPNKSDDEAACPPLGSARRSIPNHLGPKPHRANRISIQTWA